MGTVLRFGNDWLQRLPDWLRLPHFYLLAVLIAAVAFLYAAMDARPSGEAWGQIRGFGLSESEDGSRPFAYVDTPAGLRTFALPRNHGCQVGMRIKLVEMTGKRGKSYRARPYGCQGDDARGPQVH